MYLIIIPINKMTFPKKMGRCMHLSCFLTFYSEVICTAPETFKLKDYLDINSVHVFG